MIIHQIKERLIKNICNSIMIVGNFISGYKYLINRYESEEELLATIELIYSCYFFIVALFLFHFKYFPQYKYLRKIVAKQTGVFDSAEIVEACYKNEIGLIRSQSLL